MADDEKKETRLPGFRISKDGREIRGAVIQRPGHPDLVEVRSFKGDRALRESFMFERCLISAIRAELRKMEPDDDDD